VREQRWKVKGRVVAQRPTEALVLSAVFPGDRFIAGQSIKASFPSCDRAANGVTSARGGKTRGKAHGATRIKRLSRAVIVRRGQATTEIHYACRKLSRQRLRLPRPGDSVADFHCSGEILGDAVHRPIYATLPPIEHFFSLGRRHFGRRALCPIPLADAARVLHSITSVTAQCKRIPSFVSNVVVKGDSVLDRRLHFLAHIRYSKAGSHFQGVRMGPQIPARNTSFTGVAAAHDSPCLLHGPKIPQSL
jgi:hypothetical protein